MKSVYADLGDRSVLISGGATGIGATLVQAFAEQGAKVAFVDVVTQDGEQLAARLSAGKHPVRFFSCDVTNIEIYQRTLSDIANANGPISVLINNAANDVRHPLQKLASEQFDDLVAVNLKHQMFAIQSVVPMMISQGAGSIVNVGSFGWMIATPGYPVYAACKAAVHGMTRGLARELGPHRIRVNTLVPGWVMTDKQKTLWVDDAAKALIKQSQCLPDPVLPEHIAQMALFLASDAAQLCTAQNFIVDGGWT